MLIALIGLGVIVIADLHWLQEIAAEKNQTPMEKAWDDYIPD